MKVLSIEEGQRHFKAVCEEVLAGEVIRFQLADGSLLELSPVARQQRLLVTHGLDDPLIPFGPVREQVNLLKAEGIHIEWHEFVKGHTIAGEQELAVVRSFVRARFGRN